MHIGTNIGIDLLDSAGIQQCYLSWGKPAADIPFLQKYKNINIYHVLKKTRKALSRETRRRIISIVQKEKPDVILGYNPYFSAHPMAVALRFSGSPGILYLYGRMDLTREARVSNLISLCLDKSAIACGNIAMMNSACKLYKKNCVRILHKGPSYFELYDNMNVMVKQPSIFVCRTLDRPLHKEISAGLVRFSRRNKTVPITVLVSKTYRHNPRSLSFLSRRIQKIHNVSCFNRASQYDFAKKVMENNIIVSVDQAAGTSATTLQSAGFGNITLVNKNVWSPFSRNNVVFSRDISEKAFYDAFCFCADNYKELLEKFRVNNSWIKEKYNTKALYRNLFTYFNMITGSFDVDEACDNLARYYDKKIEDMKHGISYSWLGPR
jgi:hypothetical protein